MMSTKKILCMILYIFLSSPLIAKDFKNNYHLWYDRPAYNRGADYTRVVSRGYPYDEDWERWSIPIGNGAIGACIFGRTDTERIQLTEKTMGNNGAYNKGGATNFAEIYIDFHHTHAKNYRRDLWLNEAISTVSYEHKDVNYNREYFMSYPDQIMGIKIKADKAGALNFTLRPHLPYLRAFAEDGLGRSGEVIAANDLITMGGVVQHYDLPYEAQIKVVNFGGKLKADNTHGEGRIEVCGADSVVLYVACATGYELNEDVFIRPALEKFKGNVHPHEKVTQRIAHCTSKGYEAVRQSHIADYTALFSRVGLHLTDDVPALPTNRLLAQYKSGKKSIYLEELFFQYGRYLLIASSRKGSLPAHLQGAWNQYEYAPWSGGYWHNVNVQMNYWPSFNTNLAELFESYMDYNEAFRKAAVRNAVNYISKHNPSVLDPIDEENGWTIGTGANAFNIEAPGGHSGPGTGGFTLKLFWDYYDFTRDKQLLKDHIYPTLLGMAKFLSKTLVEQEDGTLLVDPSYSPEQVHQKSYYKTKGCIFDQSMIQETYMDLLRAAEILKIKDPFLKTAEEQLGRLDAILIGSSGQIKEFREEDKYGDIGEYRHRHLSHLCAMYPGATISSNTPEWLDAAIVTLNERGDFSTGWAMAHRQNLWARAKNGEKAHQLYQNIISTMTLENLWGSHPPFQIDANFGATAGVAEMLIQSHEEYIEVLPALPTAWSQGSYSGLKARGNFTVGVSWKDNKYDTLTITSNQGEHCRIKLPNTQDVSVLDSRGKKIKTQIARNNIVGFNTRKGDSYIVSFAN